MKKHNGWAYHHYQPLFYKTELYINRIVPSEHSIRFFWSDVDHAQYEVFWKPLNEEDFRLYTVTNIFECEITDLESGVDYAFYVRTKDRKSVVRLARTGKVTGTVVNYLHPLDNAYSFSGKYLCSPGLLRHPGGYLLASMDVYQGNAPQNLSLLFRSDDNGESWYHVSELFPCFWPRMFLHRGVLYILGCSTEYGDLLIGASYDGGKTFTEPTVLLRGSNGKNGMAGIHKNPQPVLSYNGRLYNTLEWGSWGQGYHAAMVMSADENADLLDAESWSFSKPLCYDESWKGVGIGHSSGTIEGCLTVGCDGNLYTVMRYDMTKLEPNYGLALRYRVNTSDPHAPLIFDRAIEFPTNHAKFQIRYDDVSQRYFSIASRITSPQQNTSRTLLSLMSSKDMLHWDTICDLLDARKQDSTGNNIGFQYVDFFYEGNDILYVCRTATNGAKNFHDSNYITFHRIKNFRNLL